MERGLLLLRIRDEARMTLHAYMVNIFKRDIWNNFVLQTLYESSTALGFRKANQVEKGKADMVKTIQRLENRNEELEQEVSDLKIKITMIEKRQQEQTESDENSHRDQLTFYKRTNQQLKSQLDVIKTIK